VSRFCAVGAINERCFFNEAFRNSSAVTGVIFFWDGRFPAAPAIG